MGLTDGTRIGAYEILGLLGMGGMGEVYKARDTRLERLVVLKTLPVEKLADHNRSRRFLVEAQAAARLNHPNIVTIYDIAEVAGLTFIAMEYVVGVTLQHLISERLVPLPLALRCAAEMADALAVAHEAGVLHRDLKPANIMISAAGRAKLLDFGLAKLMEQEAPVEDTETASLLTAPRAIVGTPAYMSPEQAQGHPLDARSDVFAFGAVLYELFSGRPAFRGDSWVSTLAAVLRDEPPALRGLNELIPAQVEHVVERCLRKDRAARFQSMLEVKEALAGAVVDEPPPNGSSIAVLPFVNLSGDKENEYFGDGLAEEIINALGKIPELKVIARTSAFAFRGSGQDLHSIGERLAVGMVLEGSVRRADQRIRVTAQLVRIADSTQVWSESFDRRLTDIFSIQDEIAQSIAQAMAVKLVPPRRRTVKIEAFQAYLQGLYWYQRYSAESLARAKTAFEAALTHDPYYAPAHAGLAVFYFGQGALSLKPMSEMAQLAKSAAEHALAIDPAQVEAHSVLALLAGAVDFDWPRAERSFREAMAIEPVPPLVRVRYALYYLTPLRRFGEAEAQYRKALETDPLSMMVHFGLAFALYCDGRHDEALRHAGRAVELYPDYWLVHFAKGLVLTQTGAIGEAIESLETTTRLAPAFTLATGFLAALTARSGNRERADQLMEAIRQRQSSEYVSPACFSVYHAALGEMDRMFEFLEASLGERDPYLTRIDAEPYFSRFREEPRYRDLLAKMRLA